MRMFVVLSNTKVAEIPGISAAGATTELIKYTPPADAEYIFYGKPKCIDAIPVDPDGHPTPAIITKASRELAKFPLVVVRAGSIIAPSLPHIFASDKPGGDIRYEDGSPEHEKLVEYGAMLAEEFKNEEIVVGESLPGGTTTALAVLRALGYDNARVSSAFRDNPVDLKEKVVSIALKRCRDAKGCGDPMISFVSGMVCGHGNVILAGGTQMLAVAAVAKDMGCKPKLIATTKYIIRDESANFAEIAREIGVDYYAANLDFSRSRYKGLRDYEIGHVKEGVGAGGSVYIAEKMGFSAEDVVRKTEELYSMLVED